MLKKWFLRLLATALPVFSFAQTSAQIEANKGVLKLSTTVQLPSPCRLGQLWFDTTAATAKQCADGATWTSVSGSSVITKDTTVTSGFATPSILGSNTNLVVEYTLSGTGVVLPTTAAPTFGGTVNFGTASSNTGIVKIFHASHSFFSSFQNSASQTASATYTLPVDDGTASQVLTTDGAGVLSWATAAGGGGNVKIAYAASSAVTITLASLATDANLLAGRESTAIDNSTNKYLDYLLAGQITTGTTPTTSKELRVYVCGIINDTTWPDVLDGTDSAETFTTSNIRDSSCKIASSMTTTATSDQTSWFAPVSVSALFGGNPPLKFVVWVVHNSAVNLNATGSNHVISITPIYRTIG